MTPDLSTLKTLFRQSLEGLSNSLNQSCWQYTNILAIPCNTQLWIIFKKSIYTPKQTSSWSISICQPFLDSRMENSSRTARTTIDGGTRIFVDLWGTRSARSSTTNSWTMLDMPGLDSWSWSLEIWWISWHIIAIDTINRVLKLTRSARSSDFSAFSRYIGLILYPPWVTLPASERSRWRTKTQLLHWDRRPPPWCWSGDPWEPMAKRKSSCGYIRCKLARCRILYTYIYIHMMHIIFVNIYIYM